MCVCVYDFTLPNLISLYIDWAIQLIGLVAKTNLFYLLFIHIGIVSHRQPSLAQRDLDLYKLYRLVRENGGMEKVTQELKWQSLYLQMSMPELPNSSYLIKQAYKR